MTRGEKFGKMLADTVIEAAHLTYNAPRGKQIVETCIRILQERLDEIQPQKADTAYKEARYGNKKTGSS